MNVAAEQSHWAPYVETFVLTNGDLGAESELLQLNPTHLIVVLPLSLRVFVCVWMCAVRPLRVVARACMSAGEAQLFVCHVSHSNTHTHTHADIRAAVDGT